VGEVIQVTIVMKGAGQIIKMFALITVIITVLKSLQYLKN
jgi:hypothetical protein